MEGIDTQDLADRLRVIGFKEDQARGLPRLVVEVVEKTAVTKVDLQLLQQDIQVLRQDIKGIRQEFERLDAKIDSLEARLDTKIDSLEARLDTKIDNVEARLSARIDTSIADLRTDMVRWIVGSQIATVAAVAAIIAMTSGF